VLVVPSRRTPSNIGPMKSQISAKVSVVLRPSAAGCLVEPRTGPVGIVVELHDVWAPGDVHRVARRQQDAQRRAETLCGHCSIGPTAVADQSNERMSRPISPPPASTASGRATSVVMCGSFRGVGRARGQKPAHLAFVDPITAAIATHE